MFMRLATTTRPLTVPVKPGSRAGYHSQHHALSNRRTGSSPGNFCAYIVDDRSCSKTIRDIPKTGSMAASLQRAYRPIECLHAYYEVYDEGPSDLAGAILLRWWPLTPLTVSTCWRAWRPRTRASGETAAPSPPATTCASDTAHTSPRPQLSCRTRHHSTRRQYPHFQRRR